MPREVPRGWRTARLGDVVTLEYGKALAASARIPGEIPVFGSSGILGYHNKPAVSGPSIVLSRKGSLGGVFFVEHGFWPIDTTYYVIQREPCDWLWLTYFLKFSSLERLNEATGVPGLNREKAAREAILIPPLPEQRRIAEILSSVDEAIAATRAVIAQTRKVKQAVLERLLTKGIGHTRFKQTEIGEIPEGWEVVSLDDLTPPDRAITYGIVQAGPDYEGGIPYIRVSDMGDREINECSIMRTSPAIASKYRRSELRQGDIVFALRGKVGHVLRTPASLAGANLTQGTARISCGERVNAEYLLWALRSPQSVRQYRREIKGSTFQELTLGSLKSIEIPLPSHGEQLKLAQNVSKIDFSEKVIEEELMSLMETRSALMSDLLTGRKRVTDALPLAAE